MDRLSRFGVALADCAVQREISAQYAVFLVDPIADFLDLQPVVARYQFAHGRPF
jgi:hypothetical protein